METGWRQGSQQVTEIVQNIWETEKLPSDWMSALIHSLHKQGDLTNTDNYWTVSLISVTYIVQGHNE